MDIPRNFNNSHMQQHPGVPHDSQSQTVNYALLRESLNMDMSPAPRPVEHGSRVVPASSGYCSPMDSNMDGISTPCGGPSAPKRIVGTQVINTLGSSLAFIPNGPCALSDGTMPFGYEPVALAFDVESPQRLRLPPCSQHLSLVPIQQSISNQEMALLPFPNMAVPAPYFNGNCPVALPTVDSVEIGDKKFLSQYNCYLEATNSHVNKIHETLDQQGLVINRLLDACCHNERNMLQKVDTLWSALQEIISKAEINFSSHTSDVQTLRTVMDDLVQQHLPLQFQNIALSINDAHGKAVAYANQVYQYFSGIGPQLEPLQNIIQNLELRISQFPDSSYFERIEAKFQLSEYDNSTFSKNLSHLSGEILEVRDKLSSVYDSTLQLKQFVVDLDDRYVPRSTFTALEDRFAALEHKLAVTTDLCTNMQNSNQILQQSMQNLQKDFLSLKSSSPGVGGAVISYSSTPTPLLHHQIFLRKLCGKIRYWVPS